MPHRDLPPLNALRVFEAVARHGQAARAADELGVTPSAVSHQLRTLEAHLAVTLFQRSRHGLVLTEAGAALVPTVRRAFDELARATRGQAEAARGRVTLALPATLALRLVVPALCRLAESHPAVLLELPEPSANDADLTIRLGWGGPDATWSRQFGRAALVPACSPGLLNRERSECLRVPADLGSAPLLHADDGAAWSRWLALAGIDAPEPLPGRRLGSTALAAAAAVAGLGLVLADTVALREDFATGRLVQPFDLALPAEEQYYVAASAGALERGPVRAVLVWLFGLVGQAVVFPPTPPEGARPPDIEP